MIIKLQKTADNLAIGLSTVCLVHCLALPVLLVLLPNLALATFSDELFHKLMLLGIIPISVVALLVGFKHHNDKSVLVIGCVGIVFLTSAAFMHHEWLGHVGEVVLTVAGSFVIAFAHFRNSRLRQFKGHTE